MEVADIFTPSFCFHSYQCEHLNFPCKTSAILDMLLLVSIYYGIMLGLCAVWPLTMSHDVYQFPFLELLDGGATCLQNVEITYPISCISILFVVERFRSCGEGICIHFSLYFFSSNAFSCIYLPNFWLRSSRFSDLKSITVLAMSIWFLKMSWDFLIKYYYFFIMYS